MQDTYYEQPCESSRALATRLETKVNTDPDVAVQDFEEIMLEPTYSGKGKGKAVDKTRPRQSTRPTFLCLPAELRNHIYELVLWQSDGIRIDEDQDMTNPPMNFLAITMTCRQMFHETRLMLYSINTFVVDFNFVFWLRSLEVDQYEAITSIELSYTLSVRLRNGVWSSAPVRQNDNYVGMVLRVLPGLRHINLAITFETGYPEGGIVLGHEDIHRCAEPFRNSFEQSQTGVRVTSTTKFEDPVAQPMHDGP